MSYEITDCQYYWLYKCKCIIKKLERYSGGGGGVNCSIHVSLFDSPSAYCCMVTSFCSCLSRRFLSCFCPSVTTSSSGGAISGLHLFFCSDRSILHKTKIIINYFSELCHNQSVHLHIAIIAISINRNQTLKIFKSITTCSETTKSTFTLVLIFTLHCLLPFPSTFLWPENEVGNN